MLIGVSIFLLHEFYDHYLHEFLLSFSSPYKQSLQPTNYTPWANQLTTHNSSTIYLDCTLPRTHMQAHTHTPVAIPAPPVHTHMQSPTHPYAYSTPLHLLKNIYKYQ